MENKTRGISYSLAGKYPILQKSFKKLLDLITLSRLEENKHNPRYLFNTVAKLTKIKHQQVLTFPNSTAVMTRAVTVAVTTASPAVVGCHRGCLLPPAVVHVTSHTYNKHNTKFYIQM